MINEKNIFLTVSWLSGLLSAEIFISTGEWGVQMPPLTAENSNLLRSESQGATLVMLPFVNSLRLSDRYIRQRIIHSDNGLLPRWHQAIFPTNIGILIIGPLEQTSVKS